MSGHSEVPVMWRQVCTAPGLDLIAGEEHGFPAWHPALSGVHGCSLLGRCLQEGARVPGRDEAVGVRRSAGHPRRHQDAPAARRHRQRHPEVARLARTEDAGAHGQPVQEPAGTEGTVLSLARAVGQIQKVWWEIKPNRGNFISSKTSKLYPHILLVRFCPWLHS